MPRFSRRLHPALAVLAVLSYVWLVQHYKNDKHTLIPNFKTLVDNFTPTGGHNPGAPPNYAMYIEMERHLPQHNLSLPFPEGITGRYVKFSNQVRTFGWNNALIDMLLCTHLAWRSKRAYVFLDYQWEPKHYPWRIWKWPPPHNPINTLIDGPSAGGPWDPGDDAPRSVNQVWWDAVCSGEDIEIIDTDVVKPRVAWSDGREVLEHWVGVLNGSPKRCVEVVPSVAGVEGWHQIFDFWLLGSPRIISLWAEFSNSPTSRLLRASRLVEMAVAENEGVLQVEGRRGYEQMMSIHLRRGDFEGKCREFANWNSSFSGWCQLPELPDRLEFEGIWYEGGHAPGRVMERYLERCWPTVERVGRKIRETKEEWEKGRGEGLGLRTLYVMTNGDEGWLARLRKEVEGDGWRMVSSRDLVLTAEQVGVGMAVDMEIGRRAAVFVGNGWSSMTSNIIHRRLVDGRDPRSNRFT